MEALQSGKMTLRIWQDGFHKLLDCRDLAQHIRRYCKQNARKQHLRWSSNAEPHEMPPRVSIAVRFRIAHQQHQADGSSVLLSSQDVVSTLCQKARSVEFGVFFSTALFR